MKNMDGDKLSLQDQSNGPLDLLWTNGLLKFQLAHRFSMKLDLLTRYDDSFSWSGNRK